tara:strand:+ start:102 stop:365 length:264 start_codon:yes stop_codon:yes gene_type:complete
MVRLGIRSAKAPAINDTNVKGKAKETIVQANAIGESVVICITSHALVVICMLIDKYEVKDPSHIHRKPGSENESSTENESFIVMKFF